MKNPRFHTDDLQTVIALLDDIAFARDSSFMQDRDRRAALGRLIAENRKVKEFAYIENFVEKQMHLPLDIGMPLRQRAEEMADWCRDRIGEIE